MRFSQETETVLAYLDEYSGQALRKRNDLGMLLEVGMLTDAAEEFNHLVFIGKIVWNVYLSLRKASPNAEGYHTLQQEFASNVGHLREHLLPFAAHASDEMRDRFEKIYLSMNEGTLRNIVDLAHDLGVLKNLQNEQKRGE